MARTATWGRAAVAALPLAGLLAGALASQARADCRAVDRDLRLAIRERAIERYPGLHKRLIEEPTCDGKYRARVGRVLALATLKTLQEEAGSAKGPFPLERIRLAAEFGQPWQVMNALGDALYAEEHWAAAVRAYEVAIDDIRDTGANPSAPPRPLEIRLAQRTYQARALAPIYVASRRFRGSPSGLADPQFRSFTAASVPVPIRFAPGKSALTRGSRQAAHDILDYLKTRKLGKVRLIGHTDPTGSEADRLKVSKARAAAVKAYLVENGYQGEIEIVGMGARKRYRPDDATRYSEAQRNAFDRRVEYQIVR